MDITKEIFNCLFNNILEKRFEETERLVEISGINPNELIKEKGINLLHLAAGMNPEEYAVKVISLLLKHGGDPNIRSEEGMTALHVGAAWGRLNVVKALLSAGGDPNFVDLEGKTPLDYAVEQDNHEMLQCFLAVECSDSPRKYSLTLDKILISNGTVEGEYYPKNILDVESFRKSDYIEKWFTKSPILKYSHLKSESDHTSDRTPTNSNNGDSKNNHLSRNSKLSSSKEFDSDEFLKTPTNNTLYKSCVSSTNNKKIQTCPSQSISIFSTDSSNKSNNCSLLSGVTPLIDTNVNNKLNTSKHVNYEPHQNYNSRSHIRKEKCEILEFYNRELLNENSTMMTSRISDETTNLEADCSSSECTNNTDHLNRALIKTSYTSHHSNLSISSTKKSNKSTFSHLDNGLITTTRGKNSSVSFIDETIPSIAEEYKYKDKEAGVSLIEKRLLVNPTQILNVSTDQSGVLTSVSSVASSLPMSINYDTDTLRKDLTSHGVIPGPITKTTKKVYLRRLHNLRKNPVIASPSDTLQSRVYSIELQKTLRNTNWHLDLSQYIMLERKLAEQFETPNPNKKWREGIIKSSFTYLLLDPRISQNLPCKAETMQTSDVWKIFLDAIFYVGKGKRSRPYSHLYEAATLYNAGQTKSDNDKVQTILNIWNDKCGVICLHIFQNVIPVEAYTREAAMIEVIGLKNLKNIKPGNYYGSVTTWSLKEKKLLGVYLLYRAMLIFLSEGERQLRPADIK